MHDLVRLHAAEQAGLDQPAAARTAALERLTCFYLHTAVAADRLLAPHRPPIDLGPPLAGHAYGEADALDSLAGAHTARADHEAARRALRQALALYQAQHRVADADRTQRKLAALGRPTAAPVDS